MANNKNALVLSAIALVKVGEKLEHAKIHLKKLVEQGFPYESEEMMAALYQFSLKRFHTFL